MESTFTGPWRAYIASSDVKDLQGRSSALSCLGMLLSRCSGQCPYYSSASAGLLSIEALANFGRLKDIEDLHIKYAVTILKEYFVAVLNTNVMYNRRPYRQYMQSKEANVVRTHIAW